MLGTIVVGGTFCDLLSCVLRMSTKLKSTWPVLSQFEKHAMAQSSLNPGWQTPKVNLFHIKIYNSHMGMLQWNACRRLLK